MPCRLYLVNCLAIYSYLIPRLPRFYPLQFATLLRVAWLTAGFAWSDVAIPPLASCGQRKGCRRWGCRLRSPEIGSRPRATAGAHLDSSHQRDLAELPAQWRGLPSRAPGRNWRSAAPPARAVLPAQAVHPAQRRGCPHCAKLTHLAHLGWSLGLCRSSAARARAERVSTALSGSGMVLKLAKSSQ